jgi:predicted TIM-barrel fold metal-dependent hydrolase
MLDGVTPVPPDFAARYTERGYWEDRPLFEGFTGALAKYADRVAMVDDEMTAVALHKGNVYWELSGWAPKYFPPSLRADIRGRLREKMMFGSDHPSLPYERILREWDELGYDQSVLDLVFHANAERVLGL